MASSSAVDADKLWQQVVEVCEKERTGPCAPSSTREVADAERRVNGETSQCEERDPTVCETIAKEKVAALPTDRDLRERCARYLHQQGFSRTAAELLGGIPSSDPQASRLLLIAARLHLSLAENGPNYRNYANGMAVYRVSNDAEADRRWVAAQLDAAASVAQRAVALAPRQADALAVLATVRERQKQPAQALSVLDSTPEVVAADTEATTQRARLLAELGRPREAIAGYRSAVSRNEFASESWQALAKLHGKLGEEDARKQAEERASYYGFLMPSSRLGFTPARAEKAQALASHFGKQTKTEADRWQATFTALDQAGDDEAAELLASFVHWHSHDDEEARAFAALERQGSKVAPVLIRLVQGSGSVCTIRQALAILSRLRPVLPETNALALQALDNDRNPFFPIDAALALARLGDVQSVVPLLTTTGCEPLARLGEQPELPGRVRGESLMAAAMLDAPAAQACIAQYRGDKELARYVAAASCLSQGEDKPCRALVKELRTQCKDTYFADSAIVGFFDAWSADRAERRLWSLQVASAFKRCQEENEKAEKKKGKQK